MTFHESPSNGSLVPCGQIDRHCESSSHFSQFCERAKQRLGGCV